MPPDATEISSEMKRAALERRGIMLNTDTILKLDEYGYAEDNGDDVFPGVHNFRRVPGTRVYAVSTLTTDAAVVSCSNLLLLLAHYGYLTSTISGLDETLELDALRHFALR